mmetsp:Transcript_24273/g.78454  ORF Transcript_24273/g.78454 Transcript_24273/m.78454 type:complete len:147 (-) Transcript_24273:2344-2784(-)
MRGGSSDPQMNFQLTTPSMTLAQQSTCKTQTLKPQWNETFAFDVEAPDEKDIISKFFFSDERPPSHDPDAKDNATIPDLTISEEDAAADTSSSSSSPKKGQQDHKGRRGNQRRTIVLGRKVEETELELNVGWGERLFLSYFCRSPS